MLFQFFPISLDSLESAAYTAELLVFLSLLFDPADL